MLDASGACCRGPCSSEQKLREQLFEQATAFCPEELQGAAANEETRLRREAVQFAVTLLGGLADFVEDTKAVAAESFLDISARFSRVVLGEVATRSKLPVTFEVGRKGKVALRVTSRQDCARLDIEPGSLFSLPVDGAVEAGNRFFTELAERGQGVGTPTAQDTDRVADSAVDWWESNGMWEGAGRRNDFANTKLSMIYDVAAKSKYGSVVPKNGLGHLLLGSLCVTPKEYRAFEWYAAKDGKIVVNCDCVDAASLLGHQDKFPTWRNALAACIEDSTITRPMNRKMAEKFAASATHFVSMRCAKGLGLRMAACEVVLRLFTPCRCPSTARQWDLMAQEWQKQADITYSCSGDGEGRIVWRRSKFAPRHADSSALEEIEHSPAREMLVQNGMFCCMNRQLCLGGSPMGRTVGCMGDADSPRSVATPSTEREVEAIAFMQKKVAESDYLRKAVERYCEGESLDGMFLRFVRARPRSSQAALALLEADMEFRDRENIHELVSMSAQDVLAREARAKAPDPSKVDANLLLEAYQCAMPHGLLGHDRAGRPVIYKGFNATTRLHDLAQLGMDTPTLVQYHLWITERLLKRCGHRGQWTVIFDLGGLSIREFNPRGLGYTHKLMRMDSAHYPERLHQCFVINAPSYLALFWRRMSTWIDAKTRRKLQLLGGRDHWGPVEEALDLRMLPVHLGGETELSLDGLCLRNPGPFSEYDATDTSKTPPGQSIRKVSKSPVAASTLRMVLVAILAVFVALQVQVHAAD